MRFGAYFTEIFTFFNNMGLVLCGAPYYYLLHTRNVHMCFMKFTYKNILTRNYQLPSGCTESTGLAEAITKGTMIAKE